MSEFASEGLPDAVVPGSMIQSVVRAAAILDLFAQDPGEWSEQDAVRMTGLNRGTVYRFFQTLVHVGYLTALPNGKYRPGTKMVAFGQMALRGLSLAEVAEPVLMQLRDTLGTTINMSVLQGSDIQYIARVRGSSLLDIRLTVGSRLPAYATSQGRAMLALLSSGEISGLLRGEEIQVRSDRSPRTTREILARVEDARRDGYAFVDGEIDPELRGVAVAVPDESGRPLAGINAAYVRALPEAEIREVIVPRLRAASEEISALMNAQSRGRE